MPRSTIKGRRLAAAAAAVFWLLVWQAAAMAVGHEILLASPVGVARKLAEISVTGVFWKSIGFSSARITAGFLLGLAAGGALAAAASLSAAVRELLRVPMSAIKAIPVASFVILLLVWISSKNLAVPLTFLMVLPIVYENVLEGIRSTDRALLEMAEAFRVSRAKRVRYIYISQVMPFFTSACRSALGLCWKAGIAAEVISLPRGSIGERLYEAKVYLETGELFAWTLVIVAISILFEKLFMSLSRAACGLLSGVRT